MSLSELEIPGNGEALMHFRCHVTAVTKDPFWDLSYLC